MVNFTRCTCSVPEEMTPKDLDNLLRVSKGMIDPFCFLHKAFIHWRVFIGVIRFSF
jgi:hypothetical protein